MCVCGTGCFDGFLKDISKEFARRVQQGNTIVLRVSLADNAVNTMNSRINGSTTLSAHIRNWVRKNAQGVTLPYSRCCG